MPCHKVWVILRRSTSAPTEIKYYLSNTPAEIAKTDVGPTGLTYQSFKL